MSSNIESAFKTLASNNGEPDNILTLRELLLKRFKSFEKSKEEISVEDLLSTHNFFLTSSFKPFISTSSVYIKTILPSFNLGTNITIDLDECFKGDFAHDMYLDVIIDPIGNPNFLYTDENQLKYRYCPYPGIRLIKKIELWLNGRKVDSYTQEDMLFYMNNELDNEKREAFKRCVGQSESKPSYCHFDVTHIDYIKHVYDGYQTFKPHHDKLHMTIPLLFWFNKYLEKSYPILKQDSILINNSKNHIKIWFSELDDIIQMGYYNNKDNEAYAKSGILDRNPNKTPYFDDVFTYSQGMVRHNHVVKPTIHMELFTNNIFVNDEIRSFYIKHIDMYMITTYQSFKLNVYKLDEIRIKDLSDMCPYLYFAFRIDNNERDFNNWHKFTFTARNWYPMTHIDRPNGGVIEVNKTLVNSFIETHRYYYYDDEQPLIKGYSLVFDTLPYIVYNNPSDYNKYMAQQKDDDYKYSHDNGIYLLKFCRKFTDAELTGHVNFNRIQEIILKYNLEPNLKNEKITLYISAKKINLLTINNNNVSLRWNSYLS